MADNALKYKEPVLKIYDNADELQINSAAFLQKLIIKSIQETDRCTLVLCGGTTPGPVYKLLSDYKDINWNKVYLFWGDERNVPPESDESNYKLVLDNLISRVNIPHENIFRIKTEKGAKAAAALYNEELRIFFKNKLPAFDIILLGIGDDGHTASLFPGNDEIYETNEWVIGYHVEKLNDERVSLTFPVINNSDNIIFLVSGINKKKIIKSYFEKENIPSLKVQPVKGELYLLCDRDAAVFIK